MCSGVALAWSELPVALIQQHGLERRVYERGGEREVHFLYADSQPCLPVWREGQLQIVRWGNGRRQSRGLPRTGWTWQATIEAGGWSGGQAALVTIPATMGLEKGVWFRVRQGMRGLLAADERGRAVAYMICVPSTRYYQVMTRSRRMPLLIDEQI